jgi:hypothetical protein
MHKLCILLSSLFAFYSSLSFGCSAVHLHNKPNLLLQPINSFYQWANNTYGDGHGRSESVTELKANIDCYFAEKIIHTLNGKQVATGRNDLYQRFKILAQKYKTVTVKLPFKDILIDTVNNKVAIAYSVHFIAKSGADKTYQAQTIFRIANNKIVRFDEVSSPSEDHL